jgi:uncharacterized repeat protein (TIGR01451 family)
MSASPSRLMVIQSYFVPFVVGLALANGGCHPSPAQEAPSDLVYSMNPAVYTRGIAIAPNVPSSSGGAVASYGVAPSLPAGLSLDASTGVIVGTPTAIAAKAAYSITASNSEGSATFSLSITVNDVACRNLAYSANPALYSRGIPIAPNVPSSSGGAVVSYALEQPLPAGLGFSTSTGVISGTPTAITPTAVYTVTATNTGGSTSTTLSITVADVPPSKLTYSANPAVFTKGIVIAPDTPSSTGGAVVSYAVSPALPAGLNFSTSSGVIAGTPTSVAATAIYTVTATNSGGSTTAALSITVNDMPPANLTYSANPATYTKGTAIMPDTPSSTGGRVASYAVSPALPAGLILSTSTGVVSGTPTAITATGIYMVTATNTGGSTTVGLSITVNDAPPSNLVYSSNPAAYTRGVAIAPNVPSSNGGAVVSYSVSSALPAGLIFNTSSGVISGIPTAVTATANYIVTATNSGGSATVSLSITVMSPPPPPVILVGPEAQPATVGMSVYFTVLASGSGPLSYQWLRNSTPISGATSPWYATPDLVLTDGSAAFSVMVNDTYGGSVASQPAGIQVGTGFAPSLGNLATARWYQTSTLLPNGQVLIAGGQGLSGYLASAELYDPTSQTFTTTGSMIAPRAGHTATLLTNGQVLIAGGENSAGYLASAELYNPASGTFTSTTGTLATARFLHTATLLPSGQVLIAGGQNPSGYLASAELYDPTSGAFTTAGSMTTARVNFTATLLPVGEVLVAGGEGGSPSAVVLVASAELYNPALGTFTVATGSLVNARYAHTATLLTSGQVLIAGGEGIPGFLASAELYSPVSETFAVTGSLATARAWHTATLMPNGEVFVAGGSGGSLSNVVPQASAELYDSRLGTFTTTGSLATARSSHTATLLTSGEVLVAGGIGTAASGGYLASAELYVSWAGIFSARPSMATARDSHTATRLPGGQVLIAGGYDNGTPLASAELFDPTLFGFSSTGSMATARFYHTATLLPGGEVLIAGGYGTTGTLSSAELYDPGSGTFTPAGSLATGRYNHTATLLPSGEVLIAGGYGTTGAVASAELYDPASGTFTFAGNMVTPRYVHTATLLTNGKVLIAGGTGLADLANAELYDPGAGTFTPTGSLVTARTYCTATLLPSGSVLVVGGWGSSGLLGSAELYDPVAGTFAATGSLVTARQVQTATLLPNGKVLIVGGQGASGFVASGELYTPTFGTFAATGSLATPRWYQTATLLPSTEVLIAGGVGSSGEIARPEIYRWW